MQEVTDPSILAKLNASSSSPAGMKEVTDPSILAKLNAPAEQSSSLAKGAMGIVNALGNPLQTSIDVLKHPTSTIMAEVGGLSKAGANTIEGINDTPAYVAQHLHLISPETANKWYKAAKEGTDILRPESGNIMTGQPDILSKSQEEHPYISKVSETAGNLSGMGYAMKAIPVAGQAVEALTKGIPFAKTILPAATRAGAMGLINAAASNPEDKDTNFVTGTIAQPLIEGMGAIAKSSDLVKKANAASLVSNLVEKGAKNSSGSTDIDMANSISRYWNHSKGTVNALYNRLKGMPFTAEDSAKAYTLGNNLSNTISDNLAFSPGQAKTLTNIADQLKTLGDHSTSVELMKGINNSSKPFYEQGTTPEAYNTFRQLQQNVRNDLIGGAAKRNGLGTTQSHIANVYDRIIGPMQDAKFDNMAEAINEAKTPADKILAAKNVFNNAYGTKSTDLTAYSKLLKYSGKETSQVISNGIVKNIFEQITKDPLPGQFNWNKAYGALDKNISKLEQIPKFSSNSLQMLQGAKRILQEAGAHFEDVNKVGNTEARNIGTKLGAYGAASLIGGAAGGEEGYRHYGGLGGLVGGTIGAVAGPLLLNRLIHFMDTPSGQNILRAISKPGFNQQDIRNIVKAMAISGVNQSGIPQTAGSIASNAYNNYSQ